MESAGGAYIRRRITEITYDTTDPATHPAVDAAVVRSWQAQLRHSAAAGERSDSDVVELLDALERAKRSIAAAQAVLSVELEQLVSEQRTHLPAARRAEGVGHQVASARLESPHRGSRHLGLAKALVHEMPGTLENLSAGTVTEWGATLLAQATACLSADQRRQVDAELAPRLPKLSERAIGAAGRAAAYDLDPRAFVTRGRRAAAHRRVTVRPAPDVMSTLSALLPAAQGVACLKALQDHADALRSRGDERSMDQIKADTLVERVTGQAQASDVRFEVGLVMTDAALLDGESTPARLEGYGPIPAPYARGLLQPEEGSKAMAWLRRLWADARTGCLAEQDPRRRRFTGQLRRFIVARDQYCRTPYCDAPIRHVDHVQRHADGGATEVTNGQGLCESCNHAKEAQGWSQATTGPGPHETIRITTPSGQARHHQPPPLLERIPPTVAPIQ